VKQADLRVGEDYALPTYKPYDGAPLAARVRLVSIDGRGKATVRVVDPGPKLPTSAWDATPVKRNEQRQVTTRSIECPWEDWAARAATIGAEREGELAAQRARYDETSRQEADRVVVDAGRALPQSYDDDHFRHAETDAEERDALLGEYITAYRLGPLATRDELQPLLVDLPVPVLRDVLAAGGHRQSAEPGTVAATFRRAATLLDNARIGEIDRLGRTDRILPHPEDLFGELEIEFITAIRDDIAAAGGELLLPPVPPLPAWVDEQDRTIASLLGWLRVAVAYTTGRLLHSPGCRTVTAYSVLESEHRPWWLVLFEDPERLCGVCGGPAVRDLVAVAGFVAAADVWRDRRRERIERWQQAAFQRLLAATTIARAQALEPDVTLTARIVTVLAEDPPAREGWAAYALVAATPSNHLEQLVDKMPPHQREEARVLARDRLTMLHDALPAAQRKLPLPQSANASVLRQRYHDLTELLHDTVPQLDRLLFTLPKVQ
jgi:hypothetical protein